MKRLTEKIALSTSLLPEFGNFLVAILKKWVFLVFLLLDGIAIVVGFNDSRFSISQIYHFSFVFIGFIGSAFLAYRDLLPAHQKISAPVEDIPKSDLSISFVTGNEYTYSISDPYSGQNNYITKMQKTKGVKCRFDERGVLFINDKVFYVMGKGSLEIHVRLENSGDLPLDVLAIRSENDLDLRYLQIFNDDVFLNGKKLQFPFHLKRGEFVVLQSKSVISLGKDSSNAEFAADSRSLPKSISHEISFDTSAADGKIQTYVSKIKTSTKPLIDLYVNQWREYDQDEYLILAGYGPALDAKDSDLD